MTVDRQSLTRWSIAAVKLAVFVLLAWFLYRALVSGNEALDEHPWHAQPGWLVLSGLLYLLGLLPAAVFWQRVMTRTGQETPFGEAMRAYYISQLGKYVPGKWMVIVLRRGLLRGAGIENTVVAATIFYETFTMLAVGAALAAVVLVIWHSHQLLLIGAAVGSTALMGVPIVPVVFQRLMQMLGVGKLNATAADRFRHIDSRTILVGWLMIAFGWMLQGMSFWATLRGMDAIQTGPFHDLSLHTATVSLSVVAGFLSQIPGGLVVREWVSMQLVEPHYGAAVSAVSVIIYRFVMLIAELAISPILYAAGWRRASKAAAIAEPELTASHEGGR